MVSNIMLAQIHVRLYEIFGSTEEPFGGQNILLLGDLLQVEINFLFFFKTVTGYFYFIFFSYHL
jgi:hypothetical protein